MTDAARRILAALEVPEEIGEAILRSQQARATVEAHEAECFREHFEREADRISRELADRLGVPHVQYDEAPL